LASDYFKIPVLLDLMERNGWRKICLLVDTQAAPQYNGQVVVDRASDFHIEISNENIHVNYNLIKTDPNYLDIFVDEIRSLDNTIIVSFSSPWNALLLFDKLIEKGASPGDYTFIGDFWVSPVTLKTEERLELGAGTITAS
jgi:hypothetical protein